MQCPRKVCVVVNSRANYGRIKSFLKAVRDHDRLELQLIVGASALLYRFGAAIETIKNDGFTPIAVVHSILEGETPTTMAKSTGLGIVELATHFENLRPDVVLTVADRFETLATAVASSYMNITLAHTQGGEVTGSIDESVRHAITKLAHIHFPATSRAKIFLEKMGEDPKSIFLTGCPAIDILTENDLSLRQDFFKDYGGVGTEIIEEKPYIIVLQHPVTTEYGSGRYQIEETLKAVEKFTKNHNIQAVWLWPNVDAGSDEIAKRLREFRESEPLSKIHFYKNFSPEDYACLLNNCSVIVGNSSSGLREGAFLGVPCVNIGTRQNNRERAENVLDAPHESKKIYDALCRQYKHARYESSDLVGSGNAGKKIAEIISNIDLNIQKNLNYLN